MFGDGKRKSMTSKIYCQQEYVVQTAIKIISYDIIFVQVDDTISSCSSADRLHIHDMQDFLTRDTRDMNEEI